MKTGRQLLDESFVMDAHLDLLYDVETKHRSGQRNVIMDEYMPDFRAGGLDAVVSSLYIDADVPPENALRIAFGQVSALYREMDASDGSFVLAKCVSDLHEAKRKGKLAIMLGFEGAEPLCADVGFLRGFYELGVRILGLCWSRPNWAADGSRFFDHEHVGYGLTEGGRDLVEYARSLNILIDVTHMNERGFWEVVAPDCPPVLASHSNARALSDTPRNLSDRQMEAIAAAGGVIGLNGASLVCDIDNPCGADVKRLAEHLLHQKSIVGMKHCCLGLDQVRRIADVALPDELSHNSDIIPEYAGLAALVDELLAYGVTEEEVRDFLGGNLLRLIGAVVG